MKNTRKPNRLKYYDYSTPGVYFITICTVDMANFFWKSMDLKFSEGLPVSGEHLSRHGKIVKESINKIEQVYPTVSVNNYVVMPNHIHLLLQIHYDGVMPNISTVIQQFKGYVTKKLGFSPWQKLFHDHVVRDLNDYDRIYRYISSNPIVWHHDCFNPKKQSTNP